MGSILRTQLAQGSGAGGAAVLWNHRNGIVFAGLGVETGRGTGGIPLEIESGIAGPNPLAQTNSRPGILPVGAEQANMAKSAPVVSDFRHISNGWTIPSEGYADQPYIVKTDDGAWLCVMTTAKGGEGSRGQHVISMRSTDKGRTWTGIVPVEPADGPEASYAVLLKVPGGRIYCFYNHNSDNVREVKREDAGVYQRVDSLGHYVFKYSDDHGRTWSAKRYDIRMSYPDLIEDGGKFFVTETQKDIGRVHELDAKFLDGLFNQWDHRAITTDGLLLDLPKDGSMPAETKLPDLPKFLARDGQRPDHGTKDLRAGFSVDLWLTLDSLAGGQVILDNRTASGQGFAVTTTDKGTINITLNDGRSESNWDCDPGVLKAGKRHHVVIIVDGGPKIIMFVMDGVLCDGGDQRQFGWGRFSPNFRGPGGAATLKIGKPVQSLRVYSRALRTSEAVGNFRAGSSR